MVAPKSAKSETLTTVSTMDACVSTEDEDFDDVEDEVEEKEQMDKKEMDKKVSWCNRCLHFDLFARLAGKLFTALTERFFRKYSPRFDLRVKYFQSDCFSFQDWSDDNIPGDLDGGY